MKRRRGPAGFVVFAAAVLLQGCRRPGTGDAAIVRYPLHGTVADTGSRGCPLEIVGSMAFTSGMNGNAEAVAAGPFSEQGYLTGRACLIEALQGLPAWTIKGMFELDVFTSDPGIAEIYSDSQHILLIQVMNSGALRVATAESVHATSRSGAVQPGVRYRFALTGTDRLLRGVIVPADGSSAPTVISMSADARLRMPINSVNFGRLAVAPDHVLQGSLADLEILGYAESDRP